MIKQDKGCREYKKRLLKSKSKSLPPVYNEKCMAAAHESNQLTLAPQDKPQLYETMEVAGETVKIILIIVILIIMNRILPEQQSIKNDIEMNLINSRVKNNPAPANRAWSTKINEVSVGEI